MKQLLKLLKYRGKFKEFSKIKYLLQSGIINKLSFKAN